MRRGARSALAVVACCGAAALLVPACSSFGEDSPPTPDAAATEAAAIDGPTNAETGSEGGAGCSASAHTFCDDFDNGALGAKWTNLITAAPVTLALVQGDVTSPPNAVLAQITAFDSGYVGGFLVKDMIQPALAKSTCRARIFVEKIGFGEPTLFRSAVQVAAGAPVTSTDVHISIKSDSTNLALFQEGKEGVYASGLPLPLGRWFELAVAIEVGTGSVAVTLDGGPFLQARFLSPPKPNNGASFKVGLFDVGGADDARVRFDDVSCDLVSE